MDTPGQFQIPHGTPGTIARALRMFELAVSKLVGGLNNPAERLQFCSAGQGWLAENQKEMVMPGVQRAGTDRNETLKLQIPNATPVRVASALRALECEVAQIISGLSNPADRLAFYGVSTLWFGEAIVLVGKTQAAGASAPGPHAA